TIADLKTNIERVRASELLSPRDEELVTTLSSSILGLSQITRSLMNEAGQDLEHKLRSEAAKLESAIKCGNRARVRDQFRRCHRLIADWFYRIDRSLMRWFGELMSIEKLVADLEKRL